VSGDYSRNTFDPKRLFSSVLMQQGRVALDQDWNESCAIIERNLRASIVDTIGRAVVPQETPNGFKITAAVVGGKKTLTMGRGRIYVHGLLAENFGAPPLTFDLATLDADGKPSGVMGELIGSDSIAFDKQPFYFGDQLPASDGPHLVYLDAWSREVTAIEDERLLEPALGGVDTTARVQTVWQVRVLANVGNVDCGTADAKIPKWSQLIQPSAARLSSRPLLVVDPDDPCLLPPKPGYRGLENQLYRVEIHAAGAAGTATFKWSRDNATVATNVVEMPDAATLVVASVGRDSVLRFSVGNWVEITNDLREFAGLPGDMRKIASVDDVTRRITFAANVSADLMNNDPKVLQAVHTRLKRWDQSGIVKDTNGKQLVNLNTASQGTIPVPTDGAPIVLENGIEITFSFDPAGGSMRSGDFWTVATRTADASVEVLDKAPPRGIHHHYCRLAVVKFPNTATDCRVLWPPQFGDAGCGCTVCVTPESHSTGTLTIYQAVDTVKKQGGGTVCLDAGFYNLADKPVVVDGAQSVTIVGQGAGTILWYTGQGAAIDIRNSIWVRVESFSVVLPPVVRFTPATTAGGGSGFLLQNAAAVTVDRCVVLQYGGGQGGEPAIRLSGVLLGVTISENALFAPQGIAAGAAQVKQSRGYLMTLNLVLRDNVLACAEKGISLEGTSIHVSDTSVAGNTIYGCSEGGIVATGTVSPPGRLDIARNLLYTTGDGIVIGTSATRIGENDIQSASALGKDGIALVGGVDGIGLQDCEIIGNRITDIRGGGIAVRNRIRSAMIKQNILRRCGEGIVMDPASSADVLVIDNNQLSDTGPTTNAWQDPVAAVRAINVEHLRVGANQIGGLAKNLLNGPMVIGIDAVGCRGVAIDGNNLDEIGADSSLVPTTAIRVQQPAVTVQITNNVVRRSPPNPAQTQSRWNALLINDLSSTGTTGTFVGSFNLVDRLQFGTAVSTGSQPSYTSSAQAGAKAALPLQILPEVQQAATAAAATPQTFRLSPLAGLYFWGDATAMFRLSRFGIWQITPVVRCHLGVQGNHFLVAGTARPLVFVVWPDACNFANNQCFMEADANAPTAVLISTSRLVVSGNVVRRSNDVNAMILQSGKSTVLGNITYGGIALNGVALPAPWDALNVLGS
jgi:hypothetical protein